MRRQAIWIAFAGLIAFLSGAQAQSDYPSRPVRVIVNSAPGGGTDILTRVLTQQLSKATRQQFIVENRGGAAGQIGLEAVARAEPDGYTLIMTPSTITVNPAVYKQVRYDAVRDFAPITQVAGISNVLLINPAVPAQTLGEFI